MGSIAGSVFTAPRKLFVALLVSLLAVILPGRSGWTQTPDALPFSKAFLVTGNYVVGAVDLNPKTAVNGLRQRHNPDEWGAGGRRDSRSLPLLGNDHDRHRTGGRRAIPRLADYGRQGIVDELESVDRAMLEFGRRIRRHLHHDDVPRRRSSPAAVLAGRERTAHRPPARQ